MNRVKPSRHVAAAICMSLLAIGVVACKEQGPVERLGEEVDEAVDTAKNGKESMATKADDAVDEVREGAKDAAHDLKD